MNELFQVDIDLNQAAFDTWLKYRKQIKKPFKSPMTIEAQQKKLIKLSEGNLLAQEKIVMQSIDEGWTGLHELKKTKAQIKKETVQSFQSLHDNLSF